MLLNNYNKLGLMAHVCNPRRKVEAGRSVFKPNLVYKVRSRLKTEKKKKQNTVYVCTNVQNNYNKMYKFNSIQMSVS